MKDADGTEIIRVEPCRSRLRSPRSRVLLKSFLFIRSISTSSSGTALVAALAVLVVILTACPWLSQSSQASFFEQIDLRYSYHPWGLVAHALGTIEGLPYSNTLEAFQRSYALGFRLFEVDLALLADGSVVAARAGMERYYGFDKTFGETSLQEFERSRFYGRYTPLTGLRLLQLMEEHKEVRIIADSKSDHSALIAGLTALGKERRYWSALDRIIPHVGSEEELEGFQRIYPFPDFMFAVYRSRMSDDEIVAFIKRRKLLAAMMDWRGGRTPALIERLQQFGVVCYVHSLRDERRIARFRSQAVGVYSDGFFPSADESAGLEVKADTGAGQFEEKTARKLITVSSPEVRNGSVYRLYVRGFERRFVEVRFRLDDRPAHVFLALLDEQGSIEYTISPETARGHYRFEAVRETSERQWRRSEPPAELLVR